MSKLGTTGWLSRMTAWLEADTRKTEATLDETWARTDMGRQGVDRRSVGFWRRKMQVFNAAGKGRYDDDPAWRPSKPPQSKPPNMGSGGRK